MLPSSVTAVSSAPEFSSGRPDSDCFSFKAGMLFLLSEVVRQLRQVVWWRSDC